MLAAVDEKEWKDKIGDQLCFETATFVMRRISSFVFELQIALLLLKQM
jgi:hypothetical protein